ncbi:CHASE2 domain-containing protein, partial [Myxococcota bacterium]|nr:CHASE2 domain-containing protein [Myxococcota bacterium]
MTSNSFPTDASPERGRAIALVVLAAMVLLQGLEAIPFQKQARAFVFDRFQRIVPRARNSSPVVIVDIDEASLERFGQWPWPRDLLARLIAAIEESSPAAIGLDILMPESDRTSPCDAAQRVPEMSAELVAKICTMPSNDERLARVLAQGRIALALAGTREGAAQGVLAAPVLMVGGDPKPLMRHFAGALGSLESLQRAARGHAMINGDGDGDNEGEGSSGVVRRIPLVATIGDTVVPAMAIELLRLASGSPAFSVHRSATRIEGVAIGDLFIPTQEDGSAWIHYGHHQANRYVSAARVLDGTLEPSLLEKRLVLVGVSGLGLVDFPVNALGERVPGVDMHAQMIESIFDGTTILRPAWARWAEVGAT